ncbi:MAG TPA: hypothetical protein VGM36_13205 [Rhizomicrobium sp.]
MNFQTRDKTLSPLQRIDRKILERATLVGIVMEVVLVVAGHYVPWVELHVFQFGGMMIAAIAGYLYGMDSAKGWGASSLGGAISGGTCGIIGIAVAVVLQEMPMIGLIVGTLICILTGTVGGLFGQMAANMKKLI